MGKPVILLGDCLEALKSMDDEIFDLVLCDPPYFDYKTGHRKDKTNKLSQSLVQQSREDMIEVVRECIKKLKQDRAFFFFTNWQEVWWMFPPFPGIWRNMIIWDKGNWTAGDLKGSFGNKYEIILLGAKGKGWEYKGGRLHDIWQIDRVGTQRIHPTQKPVALYERIINISTDEGTLIFDPYLGSGSSVIAAMKTGRNLLGYEIDEEYYRRIQERIAFFEREGKDAFD